MVTSLIWTPKSGIKVFFFFFFFLVSIRRKAVTILVQTPDVRCVDASNKHKCSVYELISWTSCLWIWANLTLFSQGEWVWIFAFQLWRKLLIWRIPLTRAIWRKFMCRVRAVGCDSPTQSNILDKSFYTGAGPGSAGYPAMYKVPNQLRSLAVLLPWGNSWRWQRLHILVVIARQINLGRFDLSPIVGFIFNIMDEQCQIMEPSQ